MTDFTWLLERGPLPLLVSMPHVGTRLPQALARRLTPAALTLADTDWHLPRLYDFLQGIGANLLVAVNSRYLIDLNRDPHVELDENRAERLRPLLCAVIDAMLAQAQANR